MSAAECIHDAQYLSIAGLTYILSGPYIASGSIWASETRVRKSLNRNIKKQKPDRDPNAGG
jgi:hypothetical protein